MTGPENKRRARIVTMLQGAENVAAIAIAECCSTALVYKIAAQENIALRRPGRPSGSTDDRVEALRHEALRLSVEEHMTPSEIAARLDRSIRSVHGYLQFFGVNGQGARGRGCVARTIGCQFSLRMEGLTLNGLRALHSALAKGDDLATSDLRAYFDWLLREAGIDLDPTQTEGEPR